MTEEQFAAYQAGLETKVELAEAALRLKSNKDFQKLVMGEYLTTFISKQVGLSVNPSLTKDMQSDSLRMAQGAGTFVNFLLAVEREGDHAATSLAQVREEPELVRGFETEESEA